MTTPDLSTTYMGLPLKNPIIASSSGLTSNIHQVCELEKNNAAAVVLKSLFEEEIIVDTEESFHAMTGRPCVYPESLNYINKDFKPGYLGRYLEFIAECKEKVNIPVIASINCVSDRKWIYFAQKIEQAGADALELNIFQLPTDFDLEPQDHLKQLQHVIEKVLQVVSIPVTVKIGPYYSNLGSTLRRVSELRIKGIVLFNRSFSPDFNIDEFDISDDFVLSTPSDLHQSLRWVALMSPYVKCDLVASSGIHDGKAMIKQLLAGARAVQIASTLYLNGFGQINVMIEELSCWMKKHNFNKLDDFRGKLSHNQNIKPAALERVQFMKYFKDFAKDLKDF